MNIDQLLQLMIKTGISDIHFKSGSAPLIRMNGRLIPTQYEKFTNESIQKIAVSLMTDDQKKIFEDEKELDFAYSIAGLSRFRVNDYKQKNSVALTLRVITLDLKTFHGLHLPEQVLQNYVMSHGD